MPARTSSTRTPKTQTLQDRVKAHIEAAEECKRWAQTAAQLHAAGKIEEATEAYEMSSRHMARMIDLA